MQFGSKPVAMLTAALFAAGFSLAGTLRADQPADEAAPESVELFQAMANGDVEVQLIVPDAEHANVLIENQTDRPLRIRLPETFAGVPVLAQFGGGGGQGVGGGFGGGGGGFGGGGGGNQGGVFDVAPAEVGKIEVPVVCLEHGKSDPTARMEYRLTELSELNDDESVYEICAMLGSGEIDQVSAQAAAWHLTDDKSWQELAVMEKVHLRNGHVEYYFGPAHLQRAQAIIVEADRRAAERPDEQRWPPKSPGEQIAEGTLSP